MTEQEKKEEQTPATSCVTWDTSDPLQQEVTRILKSFKKDLMGITFLGKDGILRSLTADRKVLSAEAMSPELIEAFLNRFPEDYRKQIIDIEGADGTKTPYEKWFEPDEGLLPAPLPQEKIDESRNMNEERREMLRKRMQEDKNIVDVSGVLG